MEKGTMEKGFLLLLALKENLAIRRTSKHNFKHAYVLFVHTSTQFYSTPNFRFWSFGLRFFPSSVPQSSHQSGTDGQRSAEQQHAAKIFYGGFGEIWCNLVFRLFARDAYTIFAQKKLKHRGQSFHRSQA
ncbi:hypothetical protein RvY_16609-1 [Ramazzottius varieornatus]|uniref:Uncharacterized protein n=1 Tax=Ramazzottius varieornatus TaxID=947166 RepID=A0A1D1W1T0_RAMVA|nr:hypothetical protein RvY_16609-1 [Ramazzottius varieornatus]